MSATVPGKTSISKEQTMTGDTMTGGGVTMTGGGVTMTGGHYDWGSL